MILDAEASGKVAWVAFTWRFDSGIVASAISDLASALAAKTTI